MQYTFSAADRELFKTTQAILDGPPEGEILSRMAEGVLREKDSVGPCLIPVDESFLRRAGADELGLLTDILGSGSTTGEPVPAAPVLQSLRATLFGRGDPGLDLQLRAGLHRLGRAAADLDVSCLQGITKDLPAAWQSGVQAAWFRLTRLEECRAAAAALRELIRNGGEK